MTSNTCTMWYLQVFYYVYIIELYDPPFINFGWNLWWSYYWMHWITFLFHRIIMIMTLYVFMGYFLCQHFFLNWGALSFMFKPHSLYLYYLKCYNDLVFFICCHMLFMQDNLQLLSTSLDIVVESCLM